MAAREVIRYVAVLRHIRPQLSQVCNPNTGGVAEQCSGGSLREFAPRLVIVREYCNLFPGQLVRIAQLPFAARPVWGSSGGPIKGLETVNVLFALDQEHRGPVNAGSV